MAIIAFWSNEEKPTGQTSSMVALSTYMSIEHNYRILDVGTAFQDDSLDSSFFNLRKMENLTKNLGQNKSDLGVESGVEGLIKIINSNKSARDVVKNYTRIVFNNRLDVLNSPKSTDFENYKQIAERYPAVLETADREYDLVFVDVSRNMPQEQAKKILELADIIIINMSQDVRRIDDFSKLREENDFFKKNNILLNIGRYDQYSKYNVKNITRYLNEKMEIHATIYNTLFFEACMESNVAELFLRFKKIEDDEDRNEIFKKEIEKLTKDIIYKIKELQIKL